jgi:hypothetical protein
MCTRSHLVAAVPVIIEDSHTSVVRPQLTPVRATCAGMRAMCACVCVRVCVASQVSRGLGSHFTIRNVVEGESFEMTFNLYHPLVLRIEVLELARRRRAKL